MNKLLILLLFVSCSTPRGNLKNISKDKGIGIISFKVFNTKGEDISSDCVVRYTYDNDDYTQSYQIDNAPHFLELRSKLNVKYLMCMKNLMVYKYEFDSFNSKINNADAYFFGEYHLEYDYKASYRDTKYYKEAKRCEYDNDRSGYCGNSSDTWTNDGKLKLLKIQKINKDSLGKEFPKHGKKIHNIHNMKPRNIL